MRLVRPEGAALRVGCYALAIVAAGFAFWLVGLEQLGFHNHPAYFFFCGMVAICAMILPGISGSYILLLVGAYEIVTGTIKDVVKLQCSQEQLVSLLIFAAGCACGLIGFSKLLKWLLARVHSPMMAIPRRIYDRLVAIDLALPRKIGERRREKQLYGPIMPVGWDREVTVCLGLAFVAMVAVLLLERWGKRRDLDEALSI